VSLLVVGLSHRSAPISLLERVALRDDAAGKLLDDVVAAPAVDEAMLLSTCNRVEVYASVDKFHAGVTAVSELLARHTAVPFDELSPFVYVHYEDRAVQHLFAVAASLDSMLVGDACSASTFPYIQVRNAGATVEHEASTSKIGEDQLFYFAQRGIGAEDAVSMIVNGFCKDVFRQLPMEFAVEATKLLGVKLEGSVG